MEKRNLTCIGCPLGCSISISFMRDQIVEIEGNNCPKGADYAKKEVTNPTRIITSLIHVQELNGNMGVISCKTSSDIPKDKIMPILREIKKTIVTPPMKIGDVLIKNIVNSGVDIVATKNYKTEL